VDNEGIGKRYVFVCSQQPDWQEICKKQKYFFFFFFFPFGVIQLMLPEAPQP
jgi:hypothetical protein